MRNAQRKIACRGEEVWAVVSKARVAAAMGGRSSVGDAGYGQVSNFYYFHLSLWATGSHFLLNILDNRHFVQVILFTWGRTLGLRRRPGGLVDFLWWRSVWLNSKALGCLGVLLWVLVVLPGVVCRSCLHCAPHHCLPNPAWTVTVTTSVTLIDSWFVSSLVVFFFKPLLVFLNDKS